MDIKPRLNGLVLAGGQSRRMGRPKSLLQYHGKPQYQHLADLLSSFCHQVFISCREDQRDMFKGCPVICDTASLGEIGPLNGVLSAFSFKLSESLKLSESWGWLVIGCDYPLLEKSDLEQLAFARNPACAATVFCHPETQMIEPLVGIYEPHCGTLLRDWLRGGNESIRRFLEQHDIERVRPNHPEHLKSVDTFEAFQRYNMHQLSTKQVQIDRYKGLSHTQETDFLAVEEPLEIRLEYGPAPRRKSQNVSITMRTPGADEDLATGFLFTEGILRQASDIFSARGLNENTVTVSLQPGIEFDPKKLERHFYTSSSCGVCGKASLDAVKVAANCDFAPNGENDWQIRPEIIYALPDALRRAQSTFDATGGLHACAIFDQRGDLLALREDVGRHNALDKLIGHYLQQGQVPLDQHLLLLSGRASFELLQKAAMAGIRLVCAVGAPSSLAVETAESFGITLIGFLREGRFNVYAGKRISKE